MAEHLPEGKDPVNDPGGAPEEEASGGASAGSTWGGEDAFDVIPGGMDEGSSPREDRGTSVRPASFAQLDERSSEGRSVGMELLMDVRLQMTAELGRTEMEISEILNLGPGSVVALDKLAGEPVDLLVNGVCIGSGEVVVVDEHFGVRVTNLISPQERVRKLA
jgi:flagellar motor switch protein FliN/FliY